MTDILPALSPLGVSVLGQLFVRGPTWDGNIISKSGRDELMRLELASKLEGGWNYLLGDGVYVATNWRAPMGGDTELARLWADKVSNR